MRLQLSQALALLFEKNERLEEQKVPANILPPRKVYTNSILCTDSRIINMVKRLRVDSARDMRHYLRHIDLPEDVDAESPEKKDEQR